MSNLYVEEGDKKLDGDLYITGRVDKSVPWITNVTGGNVNLTYVAGTDPANKVVTAVESDELVLQVYIEVDAGGWGWQPIVWVNGQIVSLSRIGTEGRRFSGNVSITMTGDGTIAITTSDLASYSIPFTQLVGPEIMTVNYAQHPDHTGGSMYCPYDQTQVSADDQVKLSGTVEVEATEIWVKAEGACVGEGLQGPFTDIVGTIFNCWPVNVGNASGNQKVTVYAKNASGAQGDDMQTMNTVACDQTYPAFGSPAIQYPTNQYALKGTEDAEVTLACTNWVSSDTAAYSDNGTGELEISNVQNGAEDLTTYQAAKWAERKAGSYRDDTDSDNYKLTVTRSGRNGRSASATTVVWIANVAPSLTVSITGSPVRLRSKTGTVKTYNVTLSSPHYLISTPADPQLERDAGDDGPTLPELSGSAPDKTWTATITIEEDDTKNTGSDVYSWSQVSAYGPAGLQTTTIGTNPDYTVGGFEQRDIEFSQFEEYNPIGTMASNKDNANLITCEAVGIGALTYYTDTNQHSMGFTITDSAGNYDPDGNYVRCLDSNIYDNVDYTLRIEEAAS